jgi:hypothetical protein
MLECLVIVDKIASITKFYSIVLLSLFNRASHLSLVSSCTPLHSLRLQLLPFWSHFPLNLVLLPRHFDFFSELTLHIAQVSEGRWALQLLNNFGHWIIFFADPLRLSILNLAMATYGKKKRSILPSLSILRDSDAGSKAKHKPPKKTGQ